MDRERVAEGSWEAPIIWTLRLGAFFDRRGAGLAEKGKNNDSLDGRKVEVFLKTPLFRFRYVLNKKEHELMDNAVRVSGTVLKEKGAGLLIKVDVLSNMKQTERELPFEEIFIPYGKIDFLVVN